ncbi:MAG TPA: haloacid dehalogenase-like hydrolase [Spirochaetales bacterium]|nr:haloacid dehalogenase-like hydrolase [Spirochaetales bacterium]HRY53382.1 haloacid dehalogenase-like hydrolase [Spirochaetia bacterium]HRZ65992.1 haloacid dehalogenase-like hydrolase [Spirochaetia bacterium]
MSAASRLSIALVASAILASAVSCATPAAAKAGPGPMPAGLNFYPANWEFCDSFIAKNGPSKPLAVFDFDNTCIYNDIMETTFRYQLFNLRYAMDKETFNGFIPEAAGKTLQDSNVLKLSADYGNVVLADLASDLEADYEFLYDNYLGAKKMTLDQIKETPEYKDFLVKLPFLYDGLTDTPEIGAEYSYPWVCFMCVGMKKDEVKALTLEALKDALARKSEKVTLKNAEGLGRKAAVASYTYKAGLRITREVVEIMRRMRAAGWEVWVVSASFEPVIQAMGGLASNGFDVPENRVIGVRLQRDAAGRYLGKLSEEPGYALTQRAGKSVVIRNLIKEAPLFVAGDSDGDFEMMTQFPEVKCILVVNRIKGGDIGSLYAEALPGKARPDRTVLLQGRDENTGEWRPYQETIKLGKQEPTALPK